MSMLHVPSSGSLTASAVESLKSKVGASVPKANGVAPKDAFVKAPKVEAWAGAG